MHVSQGQLSILISDESIDWVQMLAQYNLSFRVFVLDDLVDIPFEFLPFSILSDQSNLARQFKDQSLIDIDYEQRRLIINQSTFNAALAVDGTIQATRFSGMALN